MHNLQGDVVALIDGNGDKVVEYRYDAWGKPTCITGSKAETLGRMQPFRYREYVWDEETGLYYLRNRYYKYGTGRFTIADNIAQGNLYTYCFNSPIAQFDSNGKDAYWLTDNDNVWGLGHTSLLIYHQEEDTWYYFYWGPVVTFLYGYPKVKMQPVDVSFDDDGLLDLKAFNDMLNKQGIYEKRYNSAYRFNGDYTESAKEGIKLRERYSNPDFWKLAFQHDYDVLGSNCMQMCAKILQASNDFFSNNGLFLYHVGTWIAPSVVSLLMQLSGLLGVYDNSLDGKDLSNR